MTNNRQKILFLVGTSFSGSTLIGSSIVHKEASFLSEVDRFRLFNRHDDSYMIDECTVCHSHDKGQKCPVFGSVRIETMTKKNGLVARYLELVSSAGGLVIDASKSADWVMQLFDAGLSDHVDIYVLIVSRNPVAYAYSASTAVNEPTWASIIGWRECYTHSLRVLMHRGIPFISVKYEAMFSSSNMISRAISNLTGLDLKFIPGGDKKSSRHQIGGNLGVHIQNSEFRVESVDSLREFNVHDEGWKLNYYKNSGIQESKRWVEIGKNHAIELLMIPHVIDLAGSLGYTLDSILRYFEKP